MGTHVTPEAELFGILVDLLADKKLERNALRVLVGARGFELGRPYMHLCQQGLIQEERVRPGFWRRLLGARETLWVRVTDHGLKLAAEAFAETEPAPQDAPPQEPALQKTEALRTAEPSIPPAAPEMAKPADPPAPELVPEPAPVPVPAPEPAPEPVANPEPIPDPAPQARPAARRPPAPRRFAPADFTETLGGAPLDSLFQAPSSDRLDGLAETVGLLGFELTDAGKLLAVNRWAEGRSDAEVALEVITTALAHAARLDASGTTRLDRPAALALAVRVQETFAIYVSEGLLDAATLALGSEQLNRFLEPVASPALEDYLLDPWRGIAPSAVCPDEIYQRAEIEED